MKFTLISYMILMIVMIFILNKFVGMGNQLQEKVLGAYTTHMEKINETSGMEVYNLEKKNLSKEELEELSQNY